MYGNGKVRPAETIPGMGRQGIKYNDEWGEFNCICCKNFGNCPSVYQYKKI
jgi:hypothetical protein